MNLSTAGTRRCAAASKGRVADPQALREVRDCLGEMPRRRDLLIEYLHRLQDRFGHLSARHLVALARELRLSPAEVYEVASFYHRFDLVRDGEAPPPPLTVRVCTSVTCSLFGAEELRRRSGGRPWRGRARPARPLLGALPRGAGGGGRRAPRRRGRRPGRWRPPSPPAISPRRFPSYIDYDRYRREGGYETYRQCLSGELSPEAVLARLEASGLRGLGGAGFPVGRKWRLVRDQPAPRLTGGQYRRGGAGDLQGRPLPLHRPPSLPGGGADRR